MTTETTTAGRLAAWLDADPARRASYERGLHDETVRPSPPHRLNHWYGESRHYWEMLPATAAYFHGRADAMAARMELEEEYGR